MYYIVTNSDSTAFLKYNGSDIAVTYNLDEAHRFRLKTAKKVKHNPSNLMKQFGEWKIVQEENGEIGQIVDPEFVDIAHINCIEDKAQEIVDFINSAKHLQSLFDNLANEESEIERKLCDKYHDIELGKFSASQGYKELMELKGILLERRKIKNTRKMAQCIICSNFRGITDEKLIQKINGLGSQKYKRRIED